MGRATARAGRARQRARAHVPASSPPETLLGAEVSPEDISAMGEKQLLAGVGTMKGGPPS